MLETLTPLQIAAYGSMIALSGFTLHRVVSALDCLVMQVREGRPARRLQRALSGRGKKGGNPAPGAYLLRPEDRGRVGQAARLLDLVARGCTAGELDAAQDRFVATIDDAVAVHRHRLSRLAAVAGPLGLGFTVLALMIYLVDQDPTGATSVGGGLLEALPVSLGTTAFACFNLVVLKWAASHLSQRADRVISTTLMASDAWHALRAPAGAAR